jgi:hypothetical protein
LYTWKSGADCIVLDRDDLGALLSVWRRKESRIQWLIDDVRSWFPFHETFSRPSSDMLASLFYRACLE